MSWLNATKAKWTVFGILFGCLFPIAATLVKILSSNTVFSWNSAVQAQRVEQLLWIVDLAPFVLGIVFYLVGKRDQELQQTNQNLNNANHQLNELQAHLQQLVEERTSELAITIEQATKRANQLSVIADLSRSLVSITNTESLLMETARLISERLEHYHTAIFLLDEDNQFIILRAANSEAGHKMLERGYRLAVDHTSVEGSVALTGQPRITLDTETGAFQFPNPDLSKTRSELTLPLKSGNQVIGILDVQSMQPNAFSQEDMNTLSTLTDQVSAALENVHLHEETREALSKAETAYRQLAGETWGNIQRITPLAGYRFDGNRANPLIKNPEQEQAHGQQDAYSLPLMLRGESIGRLRITPKSKEHPWSEDEIAIIEATAERVALAVENARLVAESQKRASKEQIIGEISTKIGAAINLDNVLQTTLRELGRILPGADINIQVENK